jgi:putative FmdB family regulatory protein
MPTYEYECNLCHHRFDKRQGFDEKPLSTCPQCQGEAHRVFHAVPILFKGSGFYCTDHGHGWSGGTSAKAKEEQAEKEPAKKSSEGTTARDSSKKGGNGSSPNASKGQRESVPAEK